MPRSIQRRRGASAIEFVLCMPFVLTLLAGLIDGGLHLATMHAVSRAARDGARDRASTNETFPATGTQILAAANAAATSSINAAGFGPTNRKVVSTWLPDANGLRWITVTVTATQPPIFGSFSPFGGELTQKFTMVTQEQP